MYDGVGTGTDTTVTERAVPEVQRVMELLFLLRHGKHQDFAESVKSCL